jgi:hypothetical protein
LDPLVGDDWHESDAVLAGVNVQLPLAHAIFRAHDAAQHAVHNGDVFMEKAIALSNQMLLV